MRYITLCLALLLMVAFSGTARAQSAAPGANCNAFGNDGLTHDACVVMSNPGAGQKEKSVAICKVIQSDGMLQADGFKNFGACVSSDPSEFGPTTSSFGVSALLLTGWAAVQWRRRRRKEELLCQA